MQTEVEAFLQRIRAFPDDDAPRLILADWLEEQAVASQRLDGRNQPLPSREWGEARARFIRIQIALARLRDEDSRDGEVIGGAERDSMLKELVRHEQDLLDAHREEWMAPFYGLATGLIFRRGFVEEANVTARDLIHSAHELFDTGPLRHIHLLDVGESLPGVLQCPLLSRLIALTIHASHAGEPLARAVARCEHLQGLKSLCLTRNRFENDAAEHLASTPYLANLEEFDLSDNELGEAGAQSIAASQYLGKIRRLELRNNRLGPAGAEALAGSTRLPNLQRLGLEKNEIGTARLHSLNRTYGFLRVPCLDLSENQLGAPGLQIILNRNPNAADLSPIDLRNLDLSSNELGNNGMRVLAACPYLESLQVLRLANCGIGDDGLRILAESPYFDNLVKLDLSNNPIHDSGCWALINRSQHFKNLQRPIIPGAGISIRTRQALESTFRPR